MAQNTKQPTSTVPLGFQWELQQQVTKWSFYFVLVKTS